MLVVRLKCPNHPRYNPEKDGEGGIRGGCQFCQALFKYWLESVGLIRKVTEQL